MNSGRDRRAVLLGRLDEAHRRSEARAVAIAARITGDLAEAADLVQEAYLRARGSLERYRDETSMERWLLRIVVNLALKHVRWRDVRRRLGVFIPTPDPCTDTDELASRGDARRDLEVALQQLPAKQRAAFVLRHVEGLTLAEVAETLDVSTSSVKTHLRRGTEKLRRQLRRWEERRP